MNPVRFHEGGAIHDRTAFLILCNASNNNNNYEEMDSLQLLILYLTLTHIFSGRKAKINLHTTPKLTVAMPISCLLPCADSGIFGRGWAGGGVHVNLTKSSDNVFFFLSPQLILQKSNG